MNKKTGVSFFLGIILSLIALYFAFRNVPFADLMAYLKSINYLWVLPSTLIVFAGFILRAVRWQLILSSNQKIGLLSAYHPLIIGFMINCLLPGRVGEVARPVILKKKHDVPFSTGLATVLAERIFDLFVLIILFIFFLSTANIDPDLSIKFGDYNLDSKTLEAVFRGMIKLSVLLFVGIIVIGFDPTRKIINRITMGIPFVLFFFSSSVKKKIQHKVCAPVVNIIENFASGFSIIKSPKLILTCVVFSVIIWLLAAFTYYIFSLGCPGINLSFAQITSVMLIVCFFIALPSAPGFWGLWEAGGVFAMLLFGVPEKEAAGFTLANHAIQMFPVIVMGLISAFITGVDIRRVSYNRQRNRTY
ncbi:MAG: lysylphosphatidylglycerol synthase transmembrane domain-containing protein [Thermodesulfobacteriota bacterium]|nr:lysylphosphatidylglycerol synthase transmembrane domain-containing protein [Thermodesulfobacteriota bacterium]